MVRRVTLADVSRAAGVGMATVSRALAAQDHPDVNPATRERIRQIAKELGYRPSATARALRSGGYRALSAVVPDQTWGWWEPVIRGAFRVATQEGYQLLVHPIAGIQGGAAAVIEGLANVPTEGVMVFGSADDVAVRDAAERYNLPTVMIDDFAANVVLPTISADNRSGARTAVEHLISQGRRRIAILLAWEGSDYTDKRLAGYFDALDAAGIARDERLIIRCDDAEDESIPTWPRLDQVLEDDVEFDGLFCIADLLAAPALRSLRAGGRSVPRDVSVVGFDDERAAQLLDPPLTSIRQPYDSMGERAVHLLLRSIGGEQIPPSRVELPTKLIVRASSSHAIGERLAPKKTKASPTSR